MGSMPQRFAVVLAGGRSRRFGSDKLSAHTGGGTVLDVVLSSLPADVAIVVVGPRRPVTRNVLFVREDPEGGGPAAAVVAGVTAALRAGAEELVVLPGDAPGAGGGAITLLAALGAGAAAAVGVDAAGALQPLQVAMSRSAAERLLAAVGPDGGAQRSARSVVAALDATPVPLPRMATWDVDTPAQLAAWRVRDSAAVRTVLDVVAALPGRGLVALEGHSGVGKSTVALAVASLSGAVVVEGDDFYSTRLPTLSPAERRALTAADLAAEVIDWRRLREEALEPLLAGRDATYRPYDWEADDGRLDSPLVVRSAPVLLLDGVYSARPELADLVDAEVFLEAPWETRLRRLVERDEADAVWDALWAAAEEHYFSRVRPRSSFAVRVATA